MSATGVGASVRRKEDFRFITGRGQYTDDIARPGQVYAAFVRSPHAHAAINHVETSAAAAMPGVLAVLTGADFAADKLGNLICGWMIHSKDGSPMKMAPHPALADGKVCYVGKPVAIVIAESLAQARDAAEKVEVDHGVFPAVVDPAAAQATGAPQIHDVAPKNTIFEWRLGDARRPTPRCARRSTSRVRPAQQSARAQHYRPRAAIAEYDAGNDSFALWNTPRIHMSRVSCCRRHRGRARTQGRHDRARCRRRLGSKIFIYPEKVVCLSAAKKIRRPMKWTAEHIEAFLADAHGHDHVSHAEMGFDEKGRSSACGKDHRQCRRLYVDLLLVPGLSLRPCCRVSMISLDHSRSTRSTPTRCRSTLPRAGTPESDLCGRTHDGDLRARDRYRPRRAAPAQLRQTFRTTHLGS